MTTEIFRNTIFEAPERLDGFDFVVFDEVHYLDDRERGTVWEESIIFAPPHIRIVALSATVPNVAELADWIGQVREADVEVIVEETRPVPADPQDLDSRARPPLARRGAGVLRRPRPRRTPGPRGTGAAADPTGGRRSRRAQEERIWEASRQAPGLPRAARAPAGHLLRVQPRGLRAPRPRERAARAARSGRAPAHARAVRRARRAVRGDGRARDAAACVPWPANGVLYHHAGMLPIDKEIVERLFTTGLVKMLFATETFSLGVNMPARTVAFQSLCKFDGVKYGPILARDYWQMAGRAGRQGIDDRGWVFALLDETRIDHHDLERLQSGRTEPVRQPLQHELQRHPEPLPPRRRPRDRRVGPLVRALPAGPEAQGRRRGRARRQIRARLAVLEAYDYIRDGTLTRKGELCARVNGYEIAATEALEQRLDRPLRSRPAGHAVRGDDLRAAPIRRLGAPDALPQGHRRAVHPAHGVLRLDGARRTAWAHRRGCPTSASRGPSSSGPRAWTSTASSPRRRWPRATSCASSA